ncbi:MAG: DNA primase catalytic subunit PriS [Methanophagales archaeon]|nr:DNA primase catalytic subunit PriS [Methanophagales archaeon]
MNEQTMRFVHAKFKQYYKRTRLKLPSDLWMREWGFIFFDRYYSSKTVMRRHKAFNSGTELQSYIRDNAPAHAFHSAAIYKFPAATMGKKEWLGADLIFDLDADHVVTEAELARCSYEDLLALVKRETLKLIDFLLDDFGFHEEDLEVVFSGSRGYHIHITNDAVRQLGSRERREIIDYITATGLEMDTFLRATGDGDLKLIAEGWGKRLLDGLVEFMHELAGLEEEEAIRKIRNATGSGSSLDRRQIKEVLRIAKDQTVMNRIESGQIPRFSRLPAIWKGIVRLVTGTVRVESADRPDEPVTSDIKRLIRLPTSLHGKSSLEVKPLRVDAIPDFEPLEDAVIFGNPDVKVKATRNSSVKLKGERYELEGGEIATLPEYAALYFLCRGAAEIEMR